jgi:hypothetical protein
MRALIPTMVVATWLTLVSAPEASASIVTWDFTATATAGPLSGTSASGSFSYDSSILTDQGATYYQPNILTSLSFTWQGVSYDTTNTATPFIASGLFNPPLTSAQFAALDPSEQFGSIMFGNDCAPTACLINDSNPQDWFISINKTWNVVQFGYTDGTNSYIFNNIDYSYVAPVPLPASAWLLLTALLPGAGLLLRRNAPMRAVA